MALDQEAARMARIRLDQESDDSWDEKEEVLAKKRERSVKKKVKSVKKRETSVKREETSLKKEGTSLKKESTLLKKEDTSLKKEGTSLNKEGTSFNTEDTSFKKEDTSFKKEGSPIEMEVSSFVMVETLIEKKGISFEKESILFENEGTSFIKEGTSFEKEDSSDAMEVEPFEKEFTSDEKEPQEEKKPQDEKEAKLAAKKARLAEKYKDWPPEFPEEWKHDSSDEDEVTSFKKEGTSIEKEGTSIEKEFTSIEKETQEEIEAKLAAKKARWDEKYKDWQPEFPEEWKHDSSEEDESVGVSFGSSKGSMVETLVYDTPLPEVPEVMYTPLQVVDHTRKRMTIEQLLTLPPVPVQTGRLRPLTAEEIEAERVRVSFFTGPLAHCVAPRCPPSLHPYKGYTNPNMTNPQPAVFNRQESVESGWDNPFRPDGDLSREADEIVSLIKGGKPITPTPPALPQLCLDEVDEPRALHANPERDQTSAPKAAVSTPQKSLNGTKNGAAQIEVQKSPEPQQPEHVTIKKKPKCECCVLQ